MTTLATPSTQPTVKGGIGAPISRLDGRLKVTGGATYAAEAPIPDCAHAVLLSSVIASGKIKTIDATAARSAPGVIMVATPTNVPDMTKPEKGSPQKGNGMQEERRLPLDDWSIHYAGQYVAAVVAQTLEQAQYAARLISVDYDEKTPMLSMHDSGFLGSGKPNEHQGKDLQVHKGDVDAALTSADEKGLVVISETYGTPVETHNPMEMHATVAAWDGEDRLTVWDATQYVMGVRYTLSGAFKLKPENVRVLCPYVGGGFGSKGAQWPHTLLAAALAKSVGRPVKLMLTRAQMFTGTGHRPLTEQTMTLAASKDGQLAVIGHKTQCQGSVAGDFIETCGIGTSRVLYATPNMDITHQLNKVNIAPPTFMRAPGESPGMFALESAIDELAVALNIDPLRLRLANYAEKHPYSDKPWSSKKLRECYDIGAEKFGWQKRDPKPASMKTPDGRAMGWGMATATYPANRFPGTARIRLMRDGAGGLRAIGASATQDLGTGSWTIFTQITASQTGLPVEKVKFELGDSSLPPGPVSGGSTSAASVGQALYDAGTALKQNLLALAMQKGNSPLNGLTADQLELRNGRLISIDDPSRSEDAVELIGRGGKAYVEGFAGPPAQVGSKMQPNDQNFNANKEAYECQSFGAHFVEVIIEQPGPRVKVNRVVSVMDVGRVINPKTARSQVIGGVVMGIGMALLEETVYDTRTARPVNDNLADYAVCVNADIPNIETHFVDVPDPYFNALGCRGVGEIGITGVAGAIANAVYHATGKRIRELPITMDKLMA